MKNLFLVLSILLSSIQSFAQQNNDVEMATGLRSSGKIYVVIIVVCIIFIGFIGYLFSIDKRLKKLENQD